MEKIVPRKSHKKMAKTTQKVVKNHNKKIDGKNLKNTEKN